MKFWESNLCIILYILCIISYSQWCKAREPEYIFHEQCGVKFPPLFTSLWAFNGEGNGTPLQYFAWKIPWMEEPGRLQSMGSLKVDFTFTFHFPALEKEMATHSSVHAWRIPGTGEPGGCRLWDHTELDTTEVT